MKKLSALFLSFIMIISFVACSDTKDSSSGKDNSSQTSSKLQLETKYDGFYVEGNTLFDANGNPFVMRGINHSHTWFKDTLNTAIPAIANTGSNTVRIVLSDGQQYSKDSADSVKNIIELCKANNLIAVLEVHDVTGIDDLDKLDKTVDYWIDIKDALIGNEKYAILNIANEWIGSWKSELWRDGYTSAIPKLRDAGIKNTIMVDAAGWGQYGDSVSKYGKDVFESDTLKNTMFSIHMYGTAGKNESTIKKNIDNVINQDLCLIIGEFGYTHSDGDVDEDFLMKYTTEKNVGYLGWSWKGNGGGVEYLDISLLWDGTALSADWGEKLINGENGIKKTSKICSIFN